MLSNRHYARIAITASVFVILYSVIACLPASAFALLFCQIPAWLASLYLGATCEGTTLTLSSGCLLAVTPACGGSDFFILVCSMIVWYATAPGGSESTGGVTEEEYWNVGILEYWNTVRRHSREGRASARPRHADACPSRDTRHADACPSRDTRHADACPSRDTRHADACPSLSRSKLHYSIHGIRKTFILFFLAWAFVNVVNSMRVVLSVWTQLVSETLLPERFDAAVHMVSGVTIFFPALLCVWWICKTRICEVLNER